MRKINSVIQNYTSKGSFDMKNVKILVIDDRQIDLSIERDIKYMFGVDVDIDCGGLDLAEKIAKNRYDIIFIDYSLKNLDFMEVANRIRGMGEKYPKMGLYFMSLPIIVIIGHNALGGKKIVLGDGVDDFIPKPAPQYYVDRILRKWIPVQKKISHGNNISDKISIQDEEQDIFTESKYYDKLIVEGIGMEKCMNKCRFNKAKYLDFLKNIYKTGITGIESIENYIKHGDMSNFIEQVHFLKEFAKDIGADNLSELAKTSEIAAYSGDYVYVLDRVENLLEIYYQLISNIGDVISKNDKAYNNMTENDKLPISYMECQNEIFLILKYLDDIRPQAATKAIDKMLCCKIDTKMAKQLRTAENCIDDMDYERAIYHLSELIKSYTGDAL